MSVRLMARVFELDLPAMDKLLLLAMADHARDDGTGCYPSIEKLVKKTSLSRRGVQKIIRRLEAAGRMADTGKVSPLGTIEYTLTLDGGGEPGSPLFRAKGRTVFAGGANRRTRRGEPGSPESSLTVIREPVAARLDLAKHIERRPEPEKAVQQPNLFREVLRKKTEILPPWLQGELAEDLYHGIHGQKIAHAFFDARLLKPRDQLAACVNVAVTSLIVSRVATLKALRADQIEREAVEELLAGLATLALIQNFEARRRHTVQAVTRVVIDVCMRMLVERSGAKTANADAQERHGLGMTTDSQSAGLASGNLVNPFSFKRRSEGEQSRFD